MTELTHKMYRFNNDYYIIDGYKTMDSRKYVVLRCYRSHNDTRYLELPLDAIETKGSLMRIKKEMM